MGPSETERVNPAILELVELTNRFGSTQIPNGITREERLAFIRNLLQEQLAKSRQLAQGESNG